MTLPDSVRAARAADHDAIDALLLAAFPSAAESRLVRDLRAAGQIETEVVMPHASGIVGYLALSWLIEPTGWLALAPVAVHPDWQAKRLGSRMVAGAMKLAMIKGQSVLVLGKPSFYSRAGFSQTRAAHLTTPYPPEFLLLCRPGADLPVHNVCYPSPFGQV